MPFLDAGLFVLWGAGFEGIAKGDVAFTEAEAGCGGRPSDLLGVEKSCLSDLLGVAPTGEDTPGRSSPQKEVAFEGVDEVDASSTAGFVSDTVRFGICRSMAGVDWGFAVLLAETDGFDVAKGCVPKEKAGTEFTSVEAGCESLLIGKEKAGFGASVDGLAAFSLDFPNANELDAAATGAVVLPNEKAGLSASDCVVLTAVTPKEKAGVVVEGDFEDPAVPKLMEGVVPLPKEKDTGVPAATEPKTPVEAVARAKAPCFAGSVPEPNENGEDFSWSADAFPAPNENTLPLLDATPSAFEPSVAFKALPDESTAPKLVRVLDAIGGKAALPDVVGVFVLAPPKGVGALVANGGKAALLEEAGVLALAPPKGVGALEDMGGKALEEALG